VREVSMASREMECRGRLPRTATSLIRQTPLQYTLKFCTSLQSQHQRVWTLFVRPEEDVQTAHEMQRLKIFSLLSERFMGG
jgi:hypothetical protein